MFFIRLLVSLFELSLMVVMSGVIIYLIYRIFIKANRDFDMEEEIARGNIAVGILVATIMISSALLLEKGLAASVGMFRLSVSAPEELSLPLWQTALLTLCHLTLTLAIALFTVSATLRLFGILARNINPNMHLGDHLKKGNVAVGILLSAVVFIATHYVGEGVSSLTKALVPQPKIGTIEIMK
jgi:uncharacterized membrane protein YjfL (UPF0719 family)